MLIEFVLLHLFRVLDELKKNQNCERGENEEDKFYLNWVYPDVNRQNLCLR